MISLERFWLCFSVLASLDAACGGDCGRCRGDIWHVIFYGCFADIGIIMLAEFAGGGGVYHKIDFLVLDGIDDIRPAFMHFLDQFGLYAVLSKKLMGAAVLS